jgi:hypothetical protein
MRDHFIYDDITTFYLTPDVNYCTLFVEVMNRWRDSMKGRLKTGKDRLRWFLNFIQLKIGTSYDETAEELEDDEIDSIVHITAFDAISDTDLFGVWRDLREIAFGGLGYFAIPDQEIIKWADSRRQAIDIQLMLKATLDNILATARKPKKKYIWPISDEEATAQPLKDLRKRGISRLGVPMGAMISAEVRGEQYPEWVNAFTVASYQPTVKVLAHEDELFVGTTNIKDQLLLEFVAALRHFPLSSIKRCARKDCEAYFVEATQKPKRYCSNKCAWIMASRERREVGSAKVKGFKRNIGKSTKKGG